jgi:hypothetical protein
MSRPRKWSSESERLRAYRNRTETPIRTETPPIRTEFAEGVPTDPQQPPWLGAGRGVAREWKGTRYVLIARQDGCAAVAEDVWLNRLGAECEHGRKGWSCRLC